MKNQKEDNNQSEVNKYTEEPEKQTAWNSDNQGIKEKINQNNQTGVPRQRNTAPMKEQSITSETELNNEEIANLYLMEGLKPW